MWVMVRLMWPWLVGFGAVWLLGRFGGSWWRSLSALLVERWFGSARPR